MVSEESQNVLLLILIVLLFIGGITAFSYLFLKALGRFTVVGKYHKHIKKTMNLPEVKQFLSKAKHPFIELDQTDKELIVIWRDESLAESIWVYVDKDSIIPTKIERR